MAEKNADGFSAAERAAMKQRAAELRAEGRTGAEAAVTAAAPTLSPRTGYGMPAYANEDGSVVVFFQDAGSPVVEKQVAALVTAAVS